MTWQRRLRDIALAGGIAGGCGIQAMGGCASSSGGTNATGVPACNANPDPCCPCSNAGGGYGGAACLGSGPNSCQAQLDCMAAPTAECCRCPQIAALQGVCQKAGLLTGDGCVECLSDADCQPALVCDGSGNCVSKPTVCMSNTCVQSAGNGGSPGAGGGSSGTGGKAGTGGG